MDRLLTLDQVVRQSALCHPDWTVADHVMYVNSEAWHLDSVTAEDIEAVLTRLSIRTGVGEQV